MSAAQSIGVLKNENALLFQTADNCEMVVLPTFTVDTKVDCKYVIHCVIN